MNDGGPAFPCVIHYTYEQDVEITDPAAAAYGMVVKQTKHADTEHSGMSLRDWFAGMALQGILANPEITKTAADATLASAYALLAADAILKARSD